MELPQSGHAPVLMHEVLDALRLAPGKVIVDCTLGRAGHSRAIAERIGADGVLIGLDVDPGNLEFAKERLKDVACEVRLFHANFAELGDVLEEVGRERVDGVLADLGLSTNQLFDAKYGLSFAQAMPLDMRIDPRIRKTAADIVNTLRESELADVLYRNAQERHSRRVARKIAEARRQQPITTTDRLADLVRSAIPKRKGPPEKIDPATRTFLALRMEVNQEIANLTKFLDVAPKRLESGGRIAVISFQSMEDRLVKQAFRAGEETGSLKIVTKKPITPGDEELNVNPRSRSAKLRVAEKT